MRMFLVLALAWSGAALALDLPTPPADALVETEVCDTQIQAEILVSKDDPSTLENHPTHYEGVRCTWRVGETEMIFKDGQRTSDTSARVETRLQRLHQPTGTRDLEVLDIDVRTFAALPTGQFTSHEANLYELSGDVSNPNGQTKTLVARTADGENQELSEEVNEIKAGDLRVLTTTTRNSDSTRISNAGTRAKISFQQSVCRLTKVSRPCPLAPAPTPVS